MHVLGCEDVPAGAFTGAGNSFWDYPNGVSLGTYKDDSLRMPPLTAPSCTGAQKVRDLSVLGSGDTSRKFTMLLGSTRFTHERLRQSKRPICPCRSGNEETVTSFTELVTNDKPPRWIINRGQTPNPEPSISLNPQVREPKRW